MFQEFDYRQDCTPRKMGGITRGFDLIEDNADSTIWKIANSRLILTSLSAITDEDAIEVGFNDKEHYALWVKAYGKLDSEKMLFEKPINVDFLRSRGYALPWMGLTVDELIAAGWVKLKEV